MLMKRPLCAACLLLSAMIAACVLLTLPGAGAGEERSDSDDAPWTAAEEERRVSDNAEESVEIRNVPAALREAVIRGERARISGQVYQCRVYEDQTVLWLQKIAVSGEESGSVRSEDFLKEMCICYCEKTTVPQIGSFVWVEGTPDVFVSARNPGEFDSARYYWTQGVTFRVKNARLLAVSKSYMPFRAFLFRVQMYAQKLLFQYMPEREAGILCAMLLGEKTSLDDGVRSLYSQSGIAHVLAISGLHISMLGALLYRALRRLGMPLRASMAVCCAFLLSYSMMTGMSASTLRASVMFVIGLNAERVRRTYDMKTAFAVSMALQLLKNPRLIMTAAFQLSFGAVAGIAWLAPVLQKLCEDCLSWKRDRLPKLVNAFLSCLAVSLATLPILLAHQYEYAVYGLFFNMLVLPSMSVLLPAGFLLLFSAMITDGCGRGVQLLAVSAVPAEDSLSGVLSAAAEGLLGITGMLSNALAHAAAGCARLLLFLYERGSRIVGALPGSLLRGRPQGVRLAAYAAMLIGLVVWVELCVRMARSRRRTETCRTRMRSFLGIGWLVLALLVLLVPVGRGLRITMLDVGQGDGICIEQKHGHAILLDCGSSDQRKLFGNRLMPFLKYRGIYELDAVFLSHLDTDHVSAVYDLLEEADAERIKVGQIVIGEQIPKDEAYERLLAAADEAQVPVYQMGVGEVYAYGACRLTCLGPSAGGGKTKDRNACSLILRLDYEEFRALFMGDADAQAELAAVRTMAELAAVQTIAACTPQETIGLLKTAHHGSKYSTSEEFLELINPRVAILSAGQDNSYGHPHEETLARLRAQGCDCYLTPQSGAITIHVSKKGMWVETFLEE